MPQISLSNPNLKIWDYGRFYGTCGDRYQAAKKLTRASPTWLAWEEYTTAEQDFKKDNGYFENEQTWSVGYDDDLANCSFRISLDLYVKPKAAEDLTHWEFGYVAEVMWHDDIMDRVDSDIDALLALKRVFHAKGWFEVKEKIVEFFRQKGEDVLGTKGFEAEKNYYEKAVNDVEVQMNRRFTKATPQSQMFDIESTAQH